MLGSTPPNSKLPSNPVTFLFKVSLVFIPLFFLTIREWTHITAGLAVILACLGLYYQKNKRAYPHQFLWFTLILSLPLLSVFISQIFRFDWLARAYDAPSRLLLVLPIAAFIYQARIEFIRLLKGSLATSILLLILYAFLFPHYQDNHDIALRRLTSPFIDAIFFGFWAMLMGCLMMAFCASALAKNKNIRLVIFFGSLACLAWYLSFLSKTRTGWAALPIVILAITLYLRPQLSIKNIIYSLLVGVLIGIFIYLAIDQVKTRVDLLWDEIQLYSSGEAIDTSIGLRIQMWRLGMALFFENPFFGYGDAGYAAILQTSKFQQMVSPAAEAMALMAGFHNEFISHAVRSGIFGIVAISAVFFTPLFVFGKSLIQTNSSKVRESCLTGFIFISCVLTASLTNEMLNYKFSMTFFAYVYVGILADLYWKLNET